MKSFLLVVSLVLASGTAASSAESSRTAEAVRVSASDVVASTVIDGRLWRCFGTGCRGQSASAPASQPIVRECRRVVAQLGELNYYRSGKQVLGAAQLAACNSGVVRRTPSTEMAGAR